MNPLPLTPLPIRFKFPKLNSDLVTRLKFRPIFKQLGDYGSSFFVSGKLKNSTNDYYLEDLNVKLLLQTAGGELELGNARSEQNGDFLVQWNDTADVEVRLQQLVSGEAKYTARVYDEAGTILLVTLSNLTSSDTFLEISVTLPEVELNQNDWSDFANRFRSQNLQSVKDVADQLALAPSSTSIVQDWSVAKRQTAISHLEKAFLDPENILNSVAPLSSWQTLSTEAGFEAYRGKLGDVNLGNPKVLAALELLKETLTTFGTGLGTVGWDIDTSKLRENLSVALTANAGRYTLQPAGHLGEPLPNWRLLQDRSIPYRNYLRDLWLNTVSRLGPLPRTALEITPMMGMDQAKLQLRNRFHQDFFKSDIDEKPINDILVGILGEIMQAPRDGNFGFGIHPMGWPRRDASMTTRQYLDALAARAVVDVEELSRRYFVDFTRSDSVISTPVAVNIATLLKFFQDAFEQKPDPVHTIPDALRQPFVDFRMQHKAPFFLYFDEWEAQQEPVSLENFFQIRNIFHMENADVTLASFRSPSLNSADVTAQDRNTFTEATEIQIQLSLGYAQIDRAEWKSAQVTFEALQDRTLGFVWSLSRSEPNSSNYLDWSLRQKTALYSNSDLTRFEQQWVIPVFQATAANGNSYPLKYWINENKPKLLFSVRYLLYGILPVYKALIAQSLGDHAMACSCMMPLTDIIVRMGSLGLKTGWEEDFAWTTTGYNGNLIIRPHRGGEIPYTTTKSMEDRWVDMDDSDSVLGNRPSFHQIEQSYAKLVMGDILLEWADSIFQMNENSSIQRARELYKAVLMLYDIPLNLEPSWTSKHTQYDKGFRNPRVKSQIARARLGFEQIEAGLNFFGFEESTVPSLRYTVLKQAADAFIEAAKGVETDMINSISQLDSLTVEGMKTSAALERARMQTGIAAEQVELAQFQVSQMDQLVVNVNAQIAARKKEIEDHDSFGGQVGDFFKGFVGALGKMGSSALGGAGGAVKAEMGMGSMSDGGLMGLGAGASIMAGYAAFVYAGYMSMSSMSDAANDRTAQLEALKTKALPMAQKQVELSKRGVSIAQLNRSIAQSEVSLAQSLLDFADQRFLNSEFWLNLGNTLRRILRQYLTLGTRTAWLAERALSYEYQRNISIVRLNYYPSRQQGIGGADQLRADLAKVEAARLDSEAGSVPIKHTFSLARDFPLEFTLLRTTGKCSIRTSDATIQRAYPGMWGARIISLDAAITKASAAGAPLRGIVLQNGISQLSQNDGTLKPLVRPASALPISEFSLASPEAATVYGLPGSTLMPFEGTGTDAIWQLDFPAAGNPGGLGELIDVTLTTHLRASFSPNLYFQQSQIPPSLGNNAIVISAGRLGLRGLADLRNLAAPTNPPANAVLVFDLKNVFAIGGYKETNRVLRNLALLAITSPLENLSTNLVSAVRIGGQTVGVSMPADSGVAHSTNAPIVAPTGTPASPLNALSGISVDQVVEVVFERGPNAQAGVTRIKDFVLWIDYERFS